MHMSMRGIMRRTRAGESTGPTTVRTWEETSQVAWRSSAGRRVGWRAARAVTAARRRRVSAAIDGVWREARASSEKKSVAVLTSGEVLEGSMARYDKSGDSDSVDGMLNVHESPRGDRRISALRSQVDSRFVRDHNDVVAFLDERTLKNSLVQLRSEKKTAHKSHYRRARPCHNEATTRAGLLTRRTRFWRASRTDDRQENRSFNFLFALPP